MNRFNERGGGGGGGGGGALLNVSLEYDLERDGDGFGSAPPLLK